MGDKAYDFYILRHPAIGISESDEFVCVFPMPLFHIYGIFGMFCASLSSGGTSVIISRFDLDEYLGLIQKYKVRSLCNFLKI